MKQKITPFLNKLIDQSGIHLQYVKREDENEARFDDPLMEEAHEVTKGLVHKYKNRALLKVSYECAAHCRFCTRIRQIGNKAGRLKEKDIDLIASYLTQHPEIEDVILSGGDPLLIPALTQKVLQKIAKIESVKILRIGTRLPLQSPPSVYTPTMQKLFEEIRLVRTQKPFHILLHINHPDELTKDSIDAIRHIQQATHATFFSQTVFLRGVNIDFSVLERLFKELYFMNVLPYYLYHCDQVKGLERFEGDLEEEKKIVQQLRKSLSGLACPTYVIDVAQGYGKMPVNLDMV